MQSRRHSARGAGFGLSMPLTLILENNSTEGHLREIRRDGDK